MNLLELARSLAEEYSSAQFTAKRKKKRVECTHIKEKFFLERVIIMVQLTRSATKDRKSVSLAGELLGRKYVISCNRKLGSAFADLDLFAFWCGGCQIRVPRSMHSLSHTISTRSFHVKCNNTTPYSLLSVYQKRVSQYGCL